MEEQNNATQAMQEQQQQRMSKKKGCLIGGLVVFGILLLFGFILSKCDNENIPDNDTVSNLTSEQKETVKDSITWKITSEIDEMTDSKSIWASIRSDNFVNQDFPYEGDTYAQITVRYRKKDGYQVLVSIDMGQIFGNQFSGQNYINVRFDQNEAKKYYFNEPADGSAETVFLKNQKDFIEKCKKSHDIKMEIPLFQGGSPLFTFHVDKPLVWPED